MGTLAGTQWKPRDIAQACHDAGWRDLKLITAVAVCLAESAGYDGAWNDNTDGSRDRGLFQLNNQAHPDVDDTCAYDGVCNITAAHSIYKRSSYTFQPWAAYTNGAFRGHLDKASLGVANYTREYLNETYDLDLTLLR